MVCVWPLASWQWKERGEAARTATGVSLLSLLDPHSGTSAFLPYKNIPQLEYRDEKPRNKSLVQVL